ncbi:MAG: rhomboid family intramembrane serine protease [Flavobacteriaceae bacterium]
MYSIPPPALLLIALNVILSFRAFKSPTLFNRLSFQIGPIKRGESYRFLSAGFLHVDRSHLLFNMFSFYFFAAPVFYALGGFKFILLYLISLLGGNALAYVFHRNNDFYTAVGASGAVSGVVFSAILLYPEMELALIFFPVPMPGYVFALGYLAYTLYGIYTQRDGIGHTAHFGGALTGMILSALWQPKVVFQQPLVLGAAVIVCLGIGWIMARKNY